MPTTSARASTHDGGASSKGPASTSTQRWRNTAIATVTGIAVLLGLFFVYQNASSESSADGTTPATSYDVGSPGIGETAPQFELSSATGGTVSLDDYRGESVLLYFQEGLMCQPCWDQITDLEQAQAAFQEAGVDAIVSITSDPADLLGQKVTDQGIKSTPVLSDPELTISREYSTNQYGMMGDSRNGHSFILVGPDGTIQWRADYGGAPDYTMYVPVERLLADLRAGKTASES